MASWVGGKGASMMVFVVVESIGSCCCFCSSSGWASASPPFFASSLPAWDCPESEDGTVTLAFANGIGDEAVNRGRSALLLLMVGSVETRLSGMVDPPGLL